MYRLKKATDETGSVVLTYNNQGLVKQVDGPMGKISSVVYDKEDREQTVVDRNGISTSRQFDPLDRIRSVTWPDTGVESWGYTAGFASPSSYTNQIGKVTSNLYDPLQRRTHEWVSGIYTNRFLYNPESSISQLIDGNGSVTRWGFDAYGRAIAKTNATGQLVWTNAFNANGWQTARWTPGKGLIRFGYDAAGNQVGITNPASPSIRFGYDALNRITNMVDGVGTTAFGFSSFGKLAFEDGPWTSDRINYGYDSVRRLSGVALQQPTGGWAQSFSYDNAGRMVGTVSPAGAFVYEYSILSGFAPNRISRLRLPNAGWIDNDYDSVGRRTGTRLQNSSSSVLNRHDYILDLAGNRKKVTLTSGNTWDYTYDDSGQLLTAVGKESGGVNRLHEQLQFRYDASGNLTNRTSDALQLYITANARNEISGTSRTGTLTVAGSVTAPASSVLVNGSAATRYADNSWAKNGNALANGVNTFTAVATQTGTGTQDTTVSTINIPTSPTFNYDANGNLIWDGLKAFSFDDQDQLASIQQAGQWRSEFSYDGLRRRRVSKEYTWSGGSTSSLISNGALTATLRNDFTGFVGASITVGSSPVVVSELGRWKISGNSGSHLIKLVRASDSADVPGGAVTVNLTSGTVGTFVYGALPAPITLESFTTYYLICQEYLSGDTWYNENQPVVAATGLTINSAVWRNGSGVYFSAGSAGTSYGTLSLKGAVGSWNQTSETRYVYDGNLVVQERNSSNAPTVSYTRGLDLGGGRQGVGGIGGLLAHTTHGSPSVSHYYHADASGNITALVNVQNQISARYSHDPYGNLIGISGPMADLNRYRFSSKEVHDRSGLYLYGYRFYEPQYQRWLNRDPSEEAGGYNLYQFSRNRPSMAVDPDGRGVWEELDDYDLSDWIKNKLFDEAIGNDKPQYDPNSNLAQRFREGIGTDDFDLGDGEKRSGGELAAEVLAIPITACVDALVGGGTAKFVDFASGSIGARNFLSKSANAPCEVRLGACFVAGTLVSTDLGDRPIEEIVPGDLVWSWDEGTGRIALREVLVTMSHDDVELVHLEIGDGQIDATPEHPFWVETIGWKRAAHLQNGDILKTMSGYTRVLSVTRLSSKCRVYNFEVADFHTYFVARNQCLVHNSGGSKISRPFSAKNAGKSFDDLEKEAQRKYPDKAGRTEYHHITPKYLGGDPNGPTVPLDAAYHQEITNEFRNRWPYGQQPPSDAQLQLIMEGVYKRFPLPTGF
jgi:RHS repeat-associated protein